MYRHIKTLLIMTAVLSVVPASGQENNKKPATAKETKIMFESSDAKLQSKTNGANPLLEKWNTPYETPPFSKIRNEHYAPALREAIKRADAEVERIAAQKSKPTFVNTIEALERCGEDVDRITGVLFNLNECNTDAEMQKIVMELSPELTRFSTRINMNEKLFARVKDLYERRETLALTKEQMTLLENTYKGFIRNGVGLQGEQRKRFAEIQERLGVLSQQMNQNVLADNNDYILQVTKEDDLAGLPATAVAAARQEAQERGLEGWVFTLAYPSFGPFLTYADNRDLREQIWRAYNSRGNRGNANDNNEIIREIVALRLEMAQLLGYKTYSEYVLSNRMCESPKELEKFFDQLKNAALPAAKDDLVMVTAYAEKMGAPLPLQRWDFSYWAEKLKKEKYAFDEELLRPYFQLERVRQGIFDLYGRLYGLTFKENNKIEVYHPDVKVYEVFDGKRFMGVLYLDMHPRASKRSGAWMTEFRGQSNLGGRQVRPLIQVVCNFSKPVGDPTSGSTYTPALLSFDEVETFMHEFGHAMHGMLTDCTYPGVSGTNVKRDFVELPSQVMENWCYESEFLNTFAKHYQTGDTVPGEYIQKIKAAEKYLAGWYCVRQLSLGLVDFAFHSLEKPFEGKVEDFERKQMLELLPEVKGANSSTAFTHIFAGGYASGYYGYKWAEVLDADVFSKFKENGIFDKKTAEAFRREILSRGGTEHPAVLFRNFMGREPDIKAFMKRSGFVK